ncbi:hypothetical protein ACQPXB_41635 [Amycolatopsis sp. CA-161197]
MTNPGVYGPPKGLGQARIFMWIQVAFNLLGSLLLPTPESRACWS